MPSIVPMWSTRRRRRLAHTPESIPLKYPRLGRWTVPKVANRPVGRWRAGSVEPDTAACSIRPSRAVRDRACLTWSCGTGGPYPLARSMFSTRAAGCRRTSCRGHNPLAGFPKKTAGTCAPAVLRSGVPPYLAMVTVSAWRFPLLVSQTTATLVPALISGFLKSFRRR